MAASPSQSPMGKGDYLLLIAFCLVLFGFSLVAGRLLTGHEAVLPQNSREMAADHDWLIPKIGGQPWLERPPLPDWIIVGIDSLFGRADNDRIVRIGPILSATAVVLLVGWMAGLWYGRAIGMLAGLILATMWEFFVYATDPEADVFLCAIVTGAVALFVKLEFGQERPHGEAAHFLGRRPWLVLAFFVVWGMTNLAKGLIFGTLMAGIPVGCYLFWNGDLRTLSRYVWLWGWLAFLLVSAAWPVLAYLQYPRIWDLWTSNYLGRLNQGYIGEPFWYYAVALPYVLLPWTVPGLIGLWLTRTGALRGPQGPERFLWTWAILTPVLFSIPDGKHHHYLLQCMAPWAILASLGAARLWGQVQRVPTWLANPLWGALAIGLPGDLALVAFAPRIPGPSWLVPVLLVGLPCIGFGCYWAATRRKRRLATGSFFALLAGCYLMIYSYQTWCLTSYREDAVLLKEVRALASPDKPLFICWDPYELETCYLLFYSDERALTIPSLNALAWERGKHREAYVLARVRDQARLARFGSAELVVASKHSKYERSRADRRALFQVRFTQPRSRARK
jgi:4-amino-4-deoxy-L-arabinose transferase-like glycosyltransferase